MSYHVFECSTELDAVCPHLRYIGSFDNLSDPSQYARQKRMKSFVVIHGNSVHLRFYHWLFRSFETGHEYYQQKCLYLSDELDRHKKHCLACKTRCLETWV